MRTKPSITYKLIGLNIQFQCVPFVCVAHYVEKNIAASVVSILSDPCDQTSSYRSLGYSGY